MALAHCDTPDRLVGSTLVRASIALKRSSLPFLEFAPDGGPWLGIELEDPIGLHDGVVAGAASLCPSCHHFHPRNSPPGHRYFSCGPHNGLMLPQTGGKVQLVTGMEAELESWVRVTKSKTLHQLTLLPLAAERPQLGRGAGTQPLAEDRMGRPAIAHSAAHFAIRRARPHARGGREAAARSW